MTRYEYKGVRIYQSPATGKYVISGWNRYVVEDMAQAVRIFVMEVQRAPA